jgi:hypothetical protein
VRFRARRAVIQTLSFASATREKTRRTSTLKERRYTRVICSRRHSVLLGDGSLHLNNHWRLHVTRSHRTLLLLVRHRLQHQRVGLLEAPTLEDPSGGEEGADKGEEAAHGQSRDGARFRVAAIEPRVGDAIAVAPKFGFFAKGAAIADVQLRVFLSGSFVPARGLGIGKSEILAVTSVVIAFEVVRGSMG